MASDDAPVYRFPPTPAEVERMLVVMQWVQCLEVEQRKAGVDAGRALALARHR
jgi:hypothetical protein